MDEKLDQLANQMQQLQAAHEALLSLVRRKQQALRLGQAELVSETVALEDVSEKLEAMTGYGTSGIPVIEEF